MKLSVVLAYVIAFQLTCPFAALSQSEPVPATSRQSSIDLDLGSTDRTISLSDVGDKSVDIKVGDGVRTLQQNDLLTAAEHVAVQQILAGGQQTIQLGALGNAVGGTVNLTALSSQLNSLSVPSGLNVVHDFAGGALSLAGNLSNAGNLFAVSSNTQVTTAVISASNIFNRESAVISSVVPTNLTGLTDLASTLNLVLNAAESIVNSGIIRSSGSLTASAGSSIINLLPSGANAIMQAAGNLNLQASNIVNSGLLSSLAGNINVGSLVSDIVMNNLGGRLEALSGALNVRDSSFHGPADFLLKGGDVITRELNLFSGYGKVTVDVDQLPGLVNISAHEASVIAACDTLNLGSITLTGDPTFFNTNGNVTISNSLVFPGQHLAVLASGDIFTTSSGLSIDTSSTTANGGNILMVAGADMTSSLNELTITGGSSTGGKIDLGTSPIFSLTSRGGLSVASGNGGEITLVAYGGSGNLAGSIRLPGLNNLTIRSGGRGTGTNGNVSLIAGASNGSGTAITAGNVNTTGGAAGTGNITISTSSPSINGSAVIVDTTTGKATSGSFSPGAVQATSILFNNLTSPGSSVSVNAGANAAFGSISNVGSGVGSTGGTVNLTVNSALDTALPFIVGGSQCANCTVGDITSTSTTTGLSGNGGTILVANKGSGGIKVPNLSFLSVPVLALNGNGGQINLDAAAGSTPGALDLGGGILSANGGGGGNGGQIVLRGKSLINTSGGGAWTFSAKAANSGNGGLISITTTSAAGALSSGSTTGSIASIVAQGGLSGGHGGSVALSSGGGLSLSSSTISARPQAGSSNGPSVTLMAGTVAPGTLQITYPTTSAVFSVDGLGTGSGGSLALSSTADVTFLNAATLSARGGSSGPGGNVSIAASNLVLGSSALRIDSGSAAINVTGSLALPTGSSINAGSANITSESNLTLAAGSSINGATSVNLAASSLTNAGTISGNTLSVQAPSVSNNGALSGASISINTDSLTNEGSISAQATLQVSADGDLAISGGGALSGTTINALSTSGAVNGSMALLAGDLTGSAATSYSFSSSTGLSATSITSNNGSLTLTAGSGQLHVADQSQLSASEGDLTLLNSDLAAGKIVIGSGAVLSAFSQGTTLGRINIAIGSVPSSPAAGVGPDNLTIHRSNGGKVFFGSNSIIAMPPENAAYVDGGAIVFSTGTAPADAIKLNGGVTLNSTAQNPVPLISSLDLTDPETVALLIDLQSRGHIGGQLQIADGKLTGDVILLHSNLEETITAHNIPSAVTLTLKDFDASTPLTISLSALSTSTRVVIAGTHEFVGSTQPASGSVIINSDQAGPVLVITTGGRLTSDGALTVAANGSIAVEGIVSATALLLQTSDRNGDISLAANINGTDSLSIAAHGSGNITQTSGTLISNSLALASQTGSIGAVDQRINTLAGAISAITNGAGNIYINQNGSTQILQSQAGDQFNLQAQGGITVVQRIEANNVSLHSTAGGIALGADVIGRTAVAIEADSQGNISQSDGVISALSASLTAAGDIGTVEAPVNTTVDELSVSAGFGNASILEADWLNLNRSQAGADFQLITGGDLTVSGVSAGGSIALIGHGAMTLTENTILHARDGNVVLQNTDVINGFIAIQTKTTIIANTQDNPLHGNVTIVVGPVPQQPTPGRRPQNVLVLRPNNGDVYFGTNSISASPFNLVVANGKDVLFDTGSRPTEAISLEGLVTIYAGPLLLPGFHLVPDRATQSHPNGSQPLVANIKLTFAEEHVNIHQAAKLLGVEDRNRNDRLNEVVEFFRHSEAALRENSAEITGNDETSDLMPISYLQPTAPSADGLFRTALDRADIKFTPGTKLIEQASGSLLMKAGEALFQANLITSVLVGPCLVELPPGTVALISQYEGTVTVRNIHETRGSSIKAVLDNHHEMRIACGQEVVIGPSGIVTPDSLGRRRIKHLDLPGGRHLMRSEVSFISLMQKNHLLSNLLRSTHRDDSQLVSTLTKTAACLMVTTAGHGPYTPARP